MNNAQVWYLLISLTAIITLALVTVLAVHGDWEDLDG